MIGPLPSSAAYGVLALLDEPDTELQVRPLSSFQLRAFVRLCSGPNGRLKVFLWPLLSLPLSAGVCTT